MPSRWGQAKPPHPKVSNFEWPEGAGPEFDSYDHLYCNIGPVKCCRCGRVTCPHESNGNIGCVYCTYRTDVEEQVDTGHVSRTWICPDRPASRPRRLPVDLLANV